MINIYYGRNSLNLEKFVYDSIQGNTIILVPDQYKFTAEKQALKYLGLPCIIDMEITDVFGLGRKLINDKYIEMPQIIDSYGRHMLIGRIIKDNKENLKAFKGISDKEAFIDLVSDFIIEFKQNGGNINTLNAIDKIEGTLKDKIEDIKIIFNEYERVLENKYLDNEDFVDKYIKVILDSDEIKEKDLWIYGFENMNVIMSNLVKELSQKAKSVNIVFSYDKESKDKQFVLTGRLIERIKNDTKEVYEFEIPDSYEIDKASDLKKLEAAFQNHDMIKYEDCKPENIKIVEAANPYYEAETIAGNIFNLVMQEGYRLRDIGIICNDTNKMGSIMERTFNEYGISLFHDKTKNISSSPIVHFIINQLEFINRGYTTDDVFAMLKTGLYDIDRDDLEIFEIYANKYSLKGGMWKEKIKYGSFEYSDIELSMLEDIRARIINPIVKLEQIISQCKTYEDFALNYYDYLIEEMDFANRIEGLCNEQRDMGYLEEALSIS